MPLNDPRKGEYNEQTELQHLMYEFARRALPFMHATGYNGKHPNHVPLRDGHGAEPPFSWWLCSGKHKPYRAYVTFDAFDYFPTNEVRGETESFKLKDDNRSVKLEYDHEAISLENTIKDTVKTSKTTDVEIETHAELSVSSSISVSAKAGIEGIGEAEAKTEITTQLSTGFGRKQATSVTDEETKEFEVVVHIAPGERVAVTIELYKSKDVTEITENGYVDFCGYFDYGHAHGDQGPNGRYLSFDNRAYLLDVMDAKNRLDFPNITKPLHEGSDQVHKGVKAFYDWLKDDENFRVILRRTETVMYDTVASVNSEKIGG